jgi:2-amino-4-hydroxy-6-hydroxymethyldihydropteridine diphosphokinase
VSEVFLGLGSNVDAETHIRSGITALRTQFGGIHLSPVYETPAVGFVGEPFLNLVAGISTDMPPLELKAFLNRLEADHGRTRDVAKFSDRTLDIDILLYDDLYLVSPQIEIPRAEILDYAHVLLPLADLAGDRVHPVAGVPIINLWESFEGERANIRRVDLDL